MNDQTGRTCRSLILVIFLVFVATVHAQDVAVDAGKDAPTAVDAAKDGTKDAARALASPDAIDNRLATDNQDKPNVLDVNLQQKFDAWKARLKEQSGMDFTVDYNTLGYFATNSPGDDTAASGVFRFFGAWDLVGRGTPNNGGVIFKFENRHAYTDVAPAAFGSELGYVGLPSSVFSDQGWRITHLHWRQGFNDGHGVTYLGFLDTTDYVDIYALVSPWTAFSNLAFQNGSGAIGGLPDGALGAMVGGFLHDTVYAIGGIVDANGDPTDISNGFDTFFNDFETFKSLEFGWTTDDQYIYNAHITFWQIDEKKDAGIPDGWGMSFSLSGIIGTAWQPFFRGGWSEDGGSLYEASFSTGIGYTRQPGQSLLGVGLNWSRPNETTYGARLEDQTTIEIFQQLQLTRGIEITPSLQFINNPALNPVDDSTLLLGLRLRAAF
jgi:porin